MGMSRPAQRHETKPASIEIGTISQHRDTRLSLLEAVAERTRNLENNNVADVDVLLVVVEQQYVSTLKRGLHAAGQHHNDRAVAACRSHEPLPYHQSGEYDHGQVHDRESRLQLTRGGKAQNSWPTSPGSGLSQDGDTTTNHSFVFKHSLEPVDLLHGEISQVLHLDQLSVEPHRIPNPT